MNWTEIKIRVDTKDIENAGNIANMVVPYGIYIEDYSALEQEVMDIARIDIISSELLSKDRSSGIVHIYINPQENPMEAVDFLKTRYDSEGIKYDISLENCEEEDWLNNWKKYFHPIPIGDKLLIRPTWHSDYDPKGRVVLSLDPGVAFGTGTHETTRLCLQSLEKHIKPDSEMLDIGCGSGILTVASVLLGAKHAVGVDIDQNAVKTAKENAQLNNCADKVEILHGDLTDKISGTYDVIAANIVADAIIALSDTVPPFLNSGGVYIMSGIIDTRLAEVLSVLEGKFEILEVLTEKGWCCICARKPS